MANLVQVGRATGSRFLAALAYRDYRIMWLATMSAGSASWALIIGRAVLVYNLTGSNALVGVVIFAAMFPQFFVPFFAGFLADRMDRRRLLAYAFTVNLAHNLVLAALAISGVIQVWHLMVLSLINGTARATQMPASQALVPNLVPRNMLMNAVALNSATMNASRLIGPLLIAPIVGSMGVGWAFLLCSALYALSLVLVLRIRTASRGVIEEKKGAIGNMLAGLEYVYHHPLLISVVILSLFHCSLTMAFESLIPALSRYNLGMGDDGPLWIMAAIGSGALVTILILAGVQSEPTRGKTLLLLGFFSGVGPVILAATTSLPTALIAAAVMGGAQGGFMTLTNIMVQSIVPDSIRGRVSSIYTIHIGGTMAVFNLVDGALADVFNAPAVMATTSIAFVLVMAVSLMRAPLRAIYAGGLRTETQPQAA